MRGTESLEALAGQVLVAGWEGPEIDRRLVRAIREGALGGVIAFRRNVVSLPRWAASLHAALRGRSSEWPPPLVAVDQEGGRVRRLGPPVLQLPSARSLSALDPAWTERAAELMGLQLRALGFTMNLAPVLDLDEGSAERVVGDRSFGGDSARVVAYGGAFLRGLRRAAILGCGKHFPGHGGTEVDSHEALPRVRRDESVWRSGPLRPFEALGAALPAVMTAHLVAEGLDGTRPATLSPVVLQGWLRERLGYSGVVFSDDLFMGALRRQGALPEVAGEALMAGCDVLLLCREPARLFEVREHLAQRASVQPGFARRLREAAARFGRLRGAVPPPEPVSDPERLAEALAVPGVASLRAALGSAA